MASASGDSPCRPHAGKRLVAVGDTVFVTLGADAPVSALDAATGEVKRVYAETARADEILYSDGRLIVSINPPQSARPAVVEKDETPPPAPGKQVCAIDVSDRQRALEGGAVRRYPGRPKPGSFRPAGIVCRRRQGLPAHDRRRSSVWRLDSGEAALADRSSGVAGRRRAAARLCRDVRVPADRDGLSRRRGPAGPAGAEHAPHVPHHAGHALRLRRRDGRQLVEARATAAGGTARRRTCSSSTSSVWTPRRRPDRVRSVWGNGFKAQDTSTVDYRIQALDLQTGELQQELSTKDIFNVGHHHRCYRNKITERFLMSSRRGVEFVDLETGENYQNHWVRSGCLLGNLPCNGCSTSPRIPAVLHRCQADRIQCPGSGTGFAPPPVLMKAACSADRLTDPSRNTRQCAATASDWPTLPPRCRSAAGRRSRPWPPIWRSPGRPKIGCEAKCPGRGRRQGTGGQRRRAHRLRTGRWHAVSVPGAITAGARVKSPPTFYRGLAIFGSADGCVYCLRATDGQLVWRFQAAPERRLVAAFDQLESAWPVPGVLVQDGACWFAAGRSSYLDGGIFVYALDAQTGKLLHEQIIYSPDPDTGKDDAGTECQQLAGLLNDIPGSDGANVFIRQMCVSSDSGGNNRKHLYTSAGYLDSTWFNRTFWKIGHAQTTGPMVLGDGVAYGVEPFTARSRDVVIQPGRNPTACGACRSTRRPWPRWTGRARRCKSRRKRQTALGAASQHPCDIHG